MSEKFKLYNVCLVFVSGYLNMASVQAAVSPVAQPSRPKSVSRPKRWSEEVEEGNIHVYIFKFECCRFDTSCNKYLSLFFFHQLTDFRSLVIEMFMNIAMSSKKNP